MIRMIIEHYEMKVNERGYTQEENRTEVLRAVVAGPDDAKKLLAMAATMFDVSE